MSKHILFFGRIVCALLAIIASSAARAQEAGPLHHIVLVKFKESAAPAEIQRAVREFQLLPSRIPGITGFQWGTDNSPEGLQQGLTHGFFMTFESAAALNAYIPHPEHQAFVQILRPIAEDLFVFDFHGDAASEPAVPGRVHHLVFFKFKESASAEDIGRVNDAFADLRYKIPGLLRYQAGANTAVERGMSKGMTHGYTLTFINSDARDDYLPHPAHKAFGGVVGPVLDEVLVLDFTVRPSGRGLLVTDGLEPYRVYQRGAGGTATLSFSGLAAGDGAIEARVLSGRRVVSEFDWRAVGAASGGRFKAELAGVPTGGEYTVEVRRRDALGNVAEITEVANILVGDIWILAGQSNMEGVGNLVDVEEPHPLVHNFTMAHRWELAVEPLHWLVDSRDQVHSGGWFSRGDRKLDEDGRREVRASVRATRTKGSGLGLPFAKYLVEHTGVPVGLISAAHGGTSLTQWDPAKRDDGGASLYGSMLKQVRRGGGKVKGVLWYQGESDANPDAAPKYAERFKALVAAFRADLESPELPFYTVQIGRFVVPGREDGPWKVVQETQRTIVNEIPHTAVISVIDLPLDDLIHVGTAGLKRAGKRLARIARRELFGESEFEIGPRFEDVTIEDGGLTLRVSYSHVNGRLRPELGVTGFELQGADGADLGILYNASVDPARPSTVLLRLQRAVPDGAVLWYGDGLNPTCNLVDSRDMAACVFGPVKVK